MERWVNLRGACDIDLDLEISDFQWADDDLPENYHAIVVKFDNNY